MADPEEPEADEARAAADDAADARDDAQAAEQAAQASERGAPRRPSRRSGSPSGMRTGPARTPSSAGSGTRCGATRRSCSASSAPSGSSSPGSSSRRWPQARSVIVLIVVALFLAVGLSPVVEWLIARGLRRGFAIAIVFFVVIGAFVGFGFAVLPPVVEQSNEFVQELPDYLEDLRRNPTLRQFDDDYGFIERAQDYVTPATSASGLFGGIVGVGRVVISAVFSAFTLLIMTLYFLAALPSMKRQAYRLVPASRRERVTLLSDEVISRIGGFVSGALSVAFIAGLTSYIFLSIVGLPFALALAVLVAIFDLIPLVGATIAAVIVSLIGFTESVGVGLACIAFYVAYQQFENYFVYPRVMRKAVDVPAPLTIVAVLLGGALLGVVGALLAIPIAAAVLLVLRQVAIPRMDRT